MLSIEAHHNLSKLLKKVSFVFAWKIDFFTYPRQYEILNKWSELFCKCRH